MTNNFSRSLRMSRFNSCDAVLSDARLKKSRRFFFLLMFFASVMISLAVMSSGVVKAQGTQIPFKPAEDMVISAGQTLTTHNNANDFKNPANDPNCTITLDGGTFSFQVVDPKTNAIILGQNGIMGTRSKDFAWGNEGGTLDFSNTSGNGAEFAITRTHNSNGALTKTGNGTMYITASQTGGTADLMHTFGDLTVSGGLLHIMGCGLTDVDTTFNGDVALTNTGSLTLYGDNNFNGKVSVTGEGSLGNHPILIMTGTDGYSAVSKFAKDVTVSNQTTFVGTATTTQEFGKNAKLTVDDSTVAFRGNAMFAETVSINNNGTLMGEETGSILTFSKGVNVDNGSTIRLEGTTSLNGTSVFDHESWLFAQAGTDTTLSGTLDLKNGAHTYIYNTVTDESGNVTRAANLSITDGTKISLVGAIEKKDGITTIHETSLLLAGNTIFENNENVPSTSSISVGPYSKLYAANNVTYNGATINITGGPMVDGYDGGAVIGYASTLQAPIYFNNEEAMLTYCDLLTKYNIQTERHEVVKNRVYSTEDELNNRTYLQWDSTKDAIAMAEKNHDVVETKLVSGTKDAVTDGFGNLVIHTYSPISSQEYNPSAEPDKILHGNGYTVIFNDVNKNQLFTSYSGDTTVMQGTIVLNNETVYGVKSANSKFDVNGQSYIKDDELSAKFGQNIYYTNSEGILAFNRNNAANASAAPTLNTGSLYFMNGKRLNHGDESILGGSRLWLDTSYKDANTDRNIGTINANRVILGDKMEVWYDQISKVDNANLNFTINADELFYENTSQGNPGVLEVATKANVESIFGAAQLIDASYNAASGVVTVNAKNIADFAGEKNMTEKERAYAQKLDQNRLSDNADVAFNDALYNETSQTKVCQTIHNLSLLGFNMANRFNHFGNPTSAFFGGSTLSGAAQRGQTPEEPEAPVSAAESESVPEEPAEAADVQEEAPQQSALASDSDSGNSGLNLKRAAWASFTHTSVNGYGYNDAGFNMPGYDLRRTGIIGGLRKQFTDTFSAGLFFGYTSPEVTSGGLFEGASGAFSSDMEMEDFQYALHFEKILLKKWELAVYVGGGTQSMDWERQTVLNTSGLYNFEADGTGSTFTATAYLTRRIDMSDNWSLRPTIGFDSEHSTLSEFTERQTNINPNDPDVYMKMFTEAYEYDKTHYSRNIARVGLTSTWQGAKGFGGLSSRIFYSTQLGGEAAPQITCRSRSYTWEDMDTHAMGGESINVGAGGYWHLNRPRTLTLAADINGIWYKNATTQNVTAGLSYRY